MKFYLAVTDNNWYHYLSQLKPDEINFRQPGGKTGFKAIEPGAPFLFKLHRPYNYIVGGGFFVRHSFLPISLAWDAFGEKNGTPDYPTLKTAIQKYRSKEGRSEIDPIIGCIILSEPFFFPEEDWIDVSGFWLHIPAQTGHRFRSKVDSPSGQVRSKQETFILSRRFTKESIEEASSEHEQEVNHAKHSRNITFNPRRQFKQPANSQELPLFPYNHQGNYRPL